MLLTPLCPSRSFLSVKFVVSDPPSFHVQPPVAAFNSDDGMDTQCSLSSWPSAESWLSAATGTYTVPKWSSPSKLSWTHPCSPTFPVTPTNAPGRQWTPLRQTGRPRRTARANRSPHIFRTSISGRVYRCTRHRSIWANERRTSVVECWTGLQIRRTARSTALVCSVPMTVRDVYFELITLIISFTWLR